MFSNHNPDIVQVRRELRGKLPDRWLEEIVFTLECDQTIDELSTEDLLAFKVAAMYSPRLKRLLDSAVQRPHQTECGGRDA